MSYFRLIWSGLWRKRTRTTFTLLSIVAAFTLFGILHGIDTSFKQAIDRGRLNVLVTTSPVNLPLPLADLQQIEAVKGVTHVTHQSYLVGTYQSPTNFVIGMAVDPEHFFTRYDGLYTVSPAALTAFRRMRTGALITPGLARTLHWKLGDHVPVHMLTAPKKDGTADWTFDVVGNFDMAGDADNAPFMLMDYSYFDTARATDTGTVQRYVETIADASQAPVIANAIDNLFANSPTQTRTATEKASQQAALSQIGDLDFFVYAIVAAAFATLLLLTGTTLMQSYRERINELAVMKTLGFSDGSVAVLILSEAVMLCLGAAALGLLLANGSLDALRMVTQGTLSVTHLPWIVFLTGFAAALAIALVSAMAPSWQARRLSIVDALAVR